MISPPFTPSPQVFGPVSDCFGRGVASGMIEVGIDAVLDVEPVVMVVLSHSEGRELRHLHKSPSSEKLRSLHPVPGIPHELPISSSPSQHFLPGWNICPDRIQEVDVVEDDVAGVDDGTVVTADVILQQTSVLKHDEHEALVVFGTVLPNKISEHIDALAQVYDITGGSAVVGVVAWVVGTVVVIGGVDVTVAGVVTGATFGTQHPYHASVHPPAMPVMKSLVVVLHDDEFG